MIFMILMLGKNAEELFDDLANLILNYLTMSGCAE